VTFYFLIISYFLSLRRNDYEDYSHYNHHIMTT